MRKFRLSRRANFANVASCHDRPRADIGRGCTQGWAGLPPHPCPPDRSSDPRRPCSEAPGGWARHPFHAAECRAREAARREAADQGSGVARRRALPDWPRRTRWEYGNELRSGSGKAQEGLGGESRAGKASSAATRRRTSCACAARSTSSTRSRAAARRSSGSSMHDEPFVNTLGALTGNQAMQQVKAGLKAIYLSGWQVAADANIAGEMYPDQSLYPVNSVPHGRAPDQQHVHARRPDPAHGRQGRHRLLRADRRRRRGRLRRRAQRVRADEGDDRGGRRRRALRGPARVGQEVRPHGRQGARADARSGREARRRAARRRLHGRADDPARAHRRRGGRPRHLRRRRQRQAVLHRRAHGRGLLQDARRASTRRSRAASPTRRTRTSSGARPASPTSTSRSAFAEAIQAKYPGQDARVQLLAVVQLEEEPRRRDDRAVPARAGRDGLQVPVHHARRLPQPQLLDVQPRARLRAATT